MKKVFLILFTLFFCFSGFSFSKPNDISAIEGIIEWYGSEPFSVPALKTDANKIYIIKVNKDSSFSVKDITSLQGKKIRLEGEISKEINPANFLNEGVIFVENFCEVK